MTNQTLLTPEVLALYEDMMTQASTADLFTVHKEHLTSLIAAARLCAELEGVGEGMNERLTAMQKTIDEQRIEIAAIYWHLKGADQVLAHVGMREFHGDFPTAKAMGEHYAQRIADLERDNAELKSGQPVEVNGRMMQLLPVSLSASMIETWASIALSRIKNPAANKGFEAGMHETYAAILTASAKEMGK